MDLAFDPELERKVAEVGIIAVLMIDHDEDALPLAEALWNGGVRAVELTLRTEAALSSLKKIRSALPELIIGAGTVLSPDQLREVRDLGAAFGVAPGFNARVMQAARDLNFSFAPGIVTPTDIESALEFNCRLLKFFPAEPSGGLPYLRTIAAPYNHLQLRYIPLGGVGISNMEFYLKDPLIAALGGSWLAPREKIANKEWSAIESNAAEAVAAASRVRAVKISGL